MIFFNCSGLSPHKHINQLLKIVRNCKSLSRFYLWEKYNRQKNLFICSKLTIILSLYTLLFLRTFKASRKRSVNIDLQEKNRFVNQIEKRGMAFICILISLLYNITIQDQGPWRYFRLCLWKSMPLVLYLAGAAGGEINLWSVSVSVTSTADIYLFLFPPIHVFLRDAKKRKEKAILISKIFPDMAFWIRCERGRRLFSLSFFPLCQEVG